MSVSRRKPTSHVERNVITGMIVSDRYIREIIPLFKLEYLTVDPIRKVAEWCLDYFEQYNKAPVNHIRDLYQYHAEKTLDEDHAEYIADFLTSIDGEHARADKFNVDYILDQSILYFKEQSLRNLSDDIKGVLNAGDVDEAEVLLTQYNKVDKPLSVGINPITDVNAIQNAFESRAQPLFKLPGALGEMLNSQFTREAFILLQGPEKRGKTWWLITLGMWAHRNRCNVAFFSVGDMSEQQFVRRQHIYLAKRSDDIKYCGPMLVPVLDCEHSQNDTCQLVDRVSTCGVISEGIKLSYNEARSYKPCTFCLKEDPKRFVGAYWYKRRPAVDPLTWREAYQEGLKYEQRVRGKGMKLACFPSDSVNIKDLNRVMDRWEVEEGFIPDVIAIDYADILAPEDPREEARHRVNATFKALRRLSQERKACVITATQTDAASYDQVSVSRKNFSEDKRKYAHVTAAYGLNQTNAEKLDGVMRIGDFGLVREDASSTREVVTLGRLEMGRPLTQSYWLPNK